MAPVAFGVAAAQFTGAPLIIGCAHADHAAIGAAHHGEDAGLAGDATEQLDRIRRDLEAGHIDADCRPLPGMSAPRALHQAAEELDAGLLVVGSTSQGGAGRLVHGSTADRLLHGAPCPVAVVPPGWQAGGGISVIGAAFVDTDEGRDALRGALALARRAGAKLRVLSAAKPHGYHETFGGGRFVYTPPPGAEGVVPVDFNRAYNPPCVFTPHATCALPLPQNRLPVRIEAGEMRYGTKSV